jgi:hypothetical protein
MKTASDVYNEAAAASVKTLGAISTHHMLGALTAQVAELENELAQYKIPDAEPGNHQTAFGHMGVHLVAEWSQYDDADDSGPYTVRDVHFLWLGDADILPIVAPDHSYLPDWLDSAIDREIEEQKQ